MGRHNIFVTLCWFLPPRKTFKSKAREVGYHLPCGATTKHVVISPVSCPSCLFYSPSHISWAQRQPRMPCGASDLFAFAIRKNGHVPNRNFRGIEANGVIRPHDGCSSPKKMGASTNLSFTMRCPSGVDALSCPRCLSDRAFSHGLALL